MINIARANPYGPQTGVFDMAKCAIGALEVYFMGVRIFSKIQSGVWPNPNAVANRCLEAYNSFEGNTDINDFETIRIARSIREKNDMFSATS